MKKFLLFLFCFLATQHILAQSTFSKYITFPVDTVVGSPNLVLNSDGLYLSSTAVLNTTSLHLYVARFTTQGNPVWEKLLSPAPDAFYQLPGLQSSIWLDSVLLVSTDFFRSSDFSQQGRVIAFTENGGLLWSKDFEANTFLSDGPLVKLDNETAMRISYSASSTNDYFWRIDKINAAGDSIWSKIISAGGKYIVGVEGAILSDNRILFASIYQNNPSNAEYGLFINTLSLNGDLIEQQSIYPLPFPPLGNLAANANGSIIFYDLLKKIGNLSYPYWCLTKQSEGAANEENCISINDNLRFARSLRLAPDGSIYGVGDILLGPPPASPKAGWIFKLSEGGDMLWSRIIIDTLENLTGALTDIAFDSTGALYACGAMYEATPEGTLSRLWILQLNNNGCFDNASLCGDTIYVPDVVSSISPLIETSWLQIYPNPADDYLVVRSEYPMSFEIKNILGVTCLAGKIQAGENSINIAMLPGGVFNFVAIPENQSYITTKTIVVR